MFELIIEPQVGSENWNRGVRKFWWACGTKKRMIELGKQLEKSGIKILEIRKKERRKRK